MLFDKSPALPKLDPRVALSHVEIRNLAAPVHKHGLVVPAYDRRGVGVDLNGWLARDDLASWEGLEHASVIGSDRLLTFYPERDIGGSEHGLICVGGHVRLKIAFIEGLIQLL